MSEQKWRFAPLAGGQRQGFSDNNKESFKGENLISNLTRELCQNSLDMPIMDNVPVKVVFELKNIVTGEYSDMFSDYSNYIKGSKKYWGDEMDTKHADFIANAEKVLKSKTIPLLIVSDYNTTGAWGSPTDKINCPWASLTETDGHSCKPNENSGGSFGIGKNVTFASSALNMVFYHTTAEDTKSSFIGIAKLGSTLDKDGEPTQGTGKYLCLDSKAKYGRPIFDTDINSFRDNFIREENDYGTDVIIAGFNQSEDWIKGVTQAVLKNFFVAILEKKLVVELKDSYDHIIVDDSTIADLFTEYCSEDDKFASAFQLYKAFTEPTVKGTLSLMEENDVEIYVKLDSNYKNKIADFRSNGMLIREYPKRSLNHFASVVVVRGEELGKLLRATEPPKHDKWDANRIENDTKLRKLASKHIKDITDQVWSFVREQFGVNLGDSVDAAGLNEFLPDHIGALDEGEDLMLPKVKLGKMPVYKKPNARPVERVKVGTVSEDGTREIPNAMFQSLRIVPTDAEKGEYRVILKPDKTHERAYLKLCIINETGSTDSLNILSFKDADRGADLPISNGKVGPFVLSADAPLVFNAVVDVKGALKIGTQISEEVALCLC